MKKLGLFILILTVHLCHAQKIRGRSNTIRFKGSNILGTEAPIATNNLIPTATTQVAIKTEPEKNKPEVLTLLDLGITDAKIPRYFALLIGVSEYEYANASLPNLDQPVEDARKLRDILINHYTFDSANVTLMLNASRRQIMQKLESMADIISEKDNVFIFYAGHGYYDKTKDFGYWLASDAHIDDKSSWISNSSIKDYLGAIKSKHTLLIADACFSGSILKTRNVYASSITKFNEVYRDKSRQAMTSGNLTTVPDKSVFTYYLLKKMEENEELFLASSILFSRLFEPVVNNAPSRPRFGVIQSVGDEGGDFIFIKKK